MSGAYAQLSRIGMSPSLTPSAIHHRRPAATAEVAAAHLPDRWPNETLNQLAIELGYTTLWSRDTWLDAMRAAVHRCPEETVVKLVRDSLASGTGPWLLHVAGLMAESEGMPESHSTTGGTR